MAETLAEIPFGVENGDDNRDGYSHVGPRGNKSPFGGGGKHVQCHPRNIGIIVLRGSLSGAPRPLMTGEPNNRVYGIPGNDLAHG
jgi:hypothetical protein